MDDEHRFEVRMVETDEGISELSHLNLLAHAAESRQRSHDQRGWVRDAARSAARRALGAVEDAEREAADAVGDAVLDEVFRVLRHGPDTQG